MTKLSDYKLISGFSIWELGPKEFREYVKSLQAKYFVDKEKERLAKSTSPIQGINFRRNDKGTPILTIRRENKVLKQKDLDLIVKHYDIELDELMELIKKRKIEVKL